MECPTEFYAKQACCKSCATITKVLTRMAKSSRKEDGPSEPNSAIWAFLRISKRLSLIHI
eukprot:13516324-Alexandrium_andersonii.AAC.1